MLKYGRASQNLKNRRANRLVFGHSVVQRAGSIIYFCSGCFNAEQREAIYEARMNVIVRVKIMGHVSRGDRKESNEKGPFSLKIPYEPLHFWMGHQASEEVASCLSSKGV